MAEHPLKLIVDTSIYIPFINKGISHPLLEFGAARPVLYLSSVVVEELYAGAHDAPTIKLLDRLYDTFVRVNRLVVPGAADWELTGKIVARFDRKYGFEDTHLTRITNDILIALSARHIGAHVATNNVKDFRRIQEFADFRLIENAS